MPGELTDLPTKWLRSTRESITVAGLRASAARVLPAETVLITTRATIGAVALAAEPVATNQGFRSLVCTEGVDPTFCFHLVRRIAPELRRLGSGSTFDEISRRDLGRIVVPRPSFEEQKGIACVLDRADALVEQTQMVLEKLERLRKGVRHDLLSLGVDTEGRLRDRTRAALTPSVVGPIPSEWQTRTLDEVVARDAPLRYGIVQPGSYKPSGPPVLAIYNLDTDYRGAVFRVAPAVEARYARSRIRGDDVLLSIKGTIGRVGVVPTWFEGNITRDLARIRLRPGISPRFVRHALLDDRTQARLTRFAVGTTRLELSIWMLRRFPIALPPRHEQERIADVLDAVDARFEAERAYAHKLQLLRVGLANDLLTGRVRASEGIVADLLAAVA